MLGWMVGIAAGAFAVSFAVPAAALKALMLEKPVIAVGDVLTYADTTTGGQPGQPFKASELVVGGSAQLFPIGKFDNQENLIQVVRIAPGEGVGGLAAFSAICTHLGCAVNEKLNRDGLILCPCHGSIYDPVESRGSPPWPVRPRAVQTTPRLIPSLSPSSRHSSSRLRAVAWSPCAAAIRPNIHSVRTVPHPDRRLQRARTLHVERFGADDIAFLEQHLRHERTIHRLAHSVAQTTVDDARFLK